MASNRLGVISLIIIVAVTCSSMQEIHAKPPVQIVEGDDATIEEFPWLVSLRDYLKRHYCGGSLISNKHVLTAAHCVVKFSKGRATYDYVLSPSRITVQTGSSNSSEYKNAHKVQKIYVHEHFTLPGLGVWTRDIAIITLKHPIEPNSYQRPIALPSNNVEAGETGQLAGWGLTAEDVTLPSETLKKAVMTIWSDHRCRSTLRGYTPRHQLCAYNNERVGFCDGDSGGPLVVNNQIVGLVSNSIRCSGPYPYIYTNVFNYLDWINGILQADE